MDKTTIFFLVLWLILGAMTIVLLIVGVRPEGLVGEFIGLTSPLVYLLVRKRRK